MVDFADVLDVELDRVARPDHAGVAIEFVLGRRDLDRTRGR